MAKKVTPKNPIASRPTAAQTAEIPSAIGKMPDFFENKTLHCLLIMALSFLLYANTLFHDFTQDDAIVITDNMFTTKGFDGIGGILSKDTFYGFFKEEGKAALVAGGRYRPLSLVLFAVEYQLFGKNPFVGHLGNILFYGLTGIVLYLLLLKLLGARGEGQIPSFFIAFATTILFVAHPIHTEAVANIKGLDEILALLGSLAATYFSVRAFLEQKPVFNILAAAIFFLALLSKENAITFVAIVPLTYYFFTKASTGKIIAQTIPFVIASAAFMVLRTAVIGFQFGGVPMELMNNPYIKIINNLYVPFSPAEKLATIFFTLGKYVQLLFFPHPLTHDYYPRHIAIMSFGDWRVLLSLLVHGVMIYFAVKNFKQRNLISFGIIFFLLTLSIVSNLPFPIGTNMSERFVFMPSVGFCLVIGVLLYRFAERNMANGLDLKAVRNVFGIIAVLLVLFGFKTVSRNTVWKDNFTLFTTDVNVSENSAKLQNAVGGELTTKAANEKDPTQKRLLAADAIPHLKKALAIHPNYKNAYLLLGNAYNYTKDYDNSIAAYLNALKIDPTYKEARENLGITYTAAGRFFGEEMGNLTKAISCLKSALEIKPDDYETVRLLGVAYGVRGEKEEALKWFIKAAELNPKDAMAWLNLSIAENSLGNTAKGAEYLQKARQIDPNVGTK